MKISLGRAKLSGKGFGTISCQYQIEYKCSKYQKIFTISHIYCGQPTSLGLLGSLSVVSRGSTVRHQVIKKSRPMSEFGRVTVTTKLGQLSQIVTDFQSEQLDYDRSGSQAQKYADFTTEPPLNITQSIFFFSFFYLIVCTSDFYLKKKIYFHSNSISFNFTGIQVNQYHMLS